MKILILPAALLLGSAMVCPALADRNPTPPPSGIVIHLFGQNSVLSNVLPTTAAPAPAHTPGDHTAGADTAGNAAATGAAAPTSSGYVEPSVGDIMHQMFVTGDPNNPSKPAPGRTAEKP